MGPAIVVITKISRPLEEEKVQGGKDGGGALSHFFKLQCPKVQYEIMSKLHDCKY